jgi:ankyrin repeat protein
MAAACGGSTKCMQQLLAAFDPAAQVRAVDKDGLNALMNAARIGNVDGTRLLLSQPCAKEQAEAADEHGLTALMWAAREGRGACIQGLLQAAPSSPLALVTAVCSDQRRTALHLACMRGMDESVQALLAVEPEAQVRARDKNGMTPLMLAACHSHASCIKLLLALEPEAQTVATDSDGWSALMWAAAMPPGPQRVEGEGGRQAGAEAAAGGGAQMQCILALLTAKATAGQGPLLAQLLAVSPEGETAVALATRNGRSDVARVLERQRAKASSS